MNLGRLTCRIEFSVEFQGVSITGVLHSAGECRQISLPGASILEPLSYPRLLNPVFRVTSGHTAAQNWSWSVLSLAAMDLPSSLSGKERARWITEHGPGQNLICHPLSVSGMNKAFLGAAISESGVWCYRCSVSYL